MGFPGGHMAPSLTIGRVNNTITREPLKQCFITPEMLPKVVALFALKS